MDVNIANIDMNLKRKKIEENSLQFVCSFTMCRYHWRPSPLIGNHFLTPKCDNKPIFVCECVCVCACTWIQTLVVNIESNNNNKKNIGQTPANNN